MSRILPPVDTPLEEDEAERVFGLMLDGAPSEEEIAQYLTDLSDRGERAGEIAGAARALRARLLPIEAPENAIDVCGTGGDGHHTLNVSTAVSLVVAACGVPVAKHGNRAASSKAGAADTLEALGLDMEAAGRTAEKTLADIGYSDAATGIDPRRCEIRIAFNHQSSEIGQGVDRADGESGRQCQPSEPEPYRSCTPRLLFEHARRVRRNPQ